MKKNIDKFLIKFFDFIYKKQNENHQKKMNKLLLGSVGNFKVAKNSSATLSIKNKEEEKKVNLEKVEKIIANCLKNPKKLFSYIRGLNTPVYKIPFANKFLALIKEDEGFIYPKTGLSALYLNLFLAHKFSLKTTEMFVLRTFDVNIYAFMYQFFNWYCFKLKLSGYEKETQEQFKHVFEICETNKIDSLTLEEILSLKNAIKRDKEAIDFVLNFTKKYSTSKKSLEKIKLGQKVRV